MKNRLVLWGENSKKNKVLIALELLQSKSKIAAFTFPVSIATEEFYLNMNSDWRNGEEQSDFEFPFGFSREEFELSISGSILPKDVKVDREDVIQRAQTEWHFVVLSNKLYQVYQSELDELKSSIEQLETYEEKLWNDLKKFWNKVQAQLRDRNLLREHGDSLRTQTNDSFLVLKNLRTRLDKEFILESKRARDTIEADLLEINKRMKNEQNLTKVFDDLKVMQKQIRDVQVTREDRNEIWKQIDDTFKRLKEMRFGSDSTTSSARERLESRLQGLMGAIEKMDRSIARDTSDLEFQKRRITSDSGALETQIRQAKISMISQRIQSKVEKLKEMEETKIKLIERIEQEKQRERRQDETVE